MSTTKLLNKEQRRQRTRAKISGTPERPRLSVFVSNHHIAAQLIDDQNGKTIAAATTVGTKAKGNLTDKAKVVGEQIAEEAKRHKINAAVFDRGGKRYQGRLHALATAAREKGLEL